MHVDDSSRPHENSVRVDHKHIPVRHECPVDRAGITAGDPVEHRRVAAALEELGQLARVDGKAVPIDDRILAALLDLQVSSAPRPEGHVTMHHNPSGRVRLQWLVPDEETWGEQAKDEELKAR